jgi:hypothetical protein
MSHIFRRSKKNDGTLLCSQDLDGERPCRSCCPDGEASITGRGIRASGWGEDGDFGREGEGRNEEYKNNIKFHISYIV